MTLKIKGDKYFRWPWRASSIAALFKLMRTQVSPKQMDVRPDRSTARKLPAIYEIYRRHHESLLCASDGAERPEGIQDRRRIPASVLTIYKRKSVKVNTGGIVYAANSSLDSVAVACLVCAQRLRRRQENRFHRRQPSHPAGRT